MFVLFLFRCGFAGENGPRCIIPSEVKKQKSELVREGIKSWRKKIGREGSQWESHRFPVIFFLKKERKKGKKRKKNDLYHINLK